MSVHSPGREVTYTAHKIANAEMPFFNFRSIRPTSAKFRHSKENSNFPWANRLQTFTCSDKSKIKQLIMHFSWYESSNNRKLQFIAFFIYWKILVYTTLMVPWDADKLRAVYLVSELAKQLPWLAVVVQTDTNTAALCLCQCFTCLDWTNQRFSQHSE